MFTGTNLIFACYRWKNILITQPQRECRLQIESTPPPPQGLEFGCFPSCGWPGSLAWLGWWDHHTRVRWVQTRLLQHVPKQAVALVLQTPHITQQITDRAFSLPFAFASHFISCSHLSLDKRDKRSFSDLISQWELFALESTYTHVNWEQSSEWGPENCTHVNFLVGWFLLISLEWDGARNWSHDQLTIFQKAEHMDQCLFFWLVLYLGIIVCN